MKMRQIYVTADKDESVTRTPAEAQDQNETRFALKKPSDDGEIVPRIHLLLPFAQRYIKFIVGFALLVRLYSCVKTHGKTES